MKSVEALKATSLEWTSFQNVYFMDYYGMPYVETHLKPLMFVLDVRNSAASIPATGDEIMTLTYTKDLAKFVSALLDLPQWFYPMVCYSDKTTWNQALKVAEEMKGMRCDSLQLRSANHTNTYNNYRKQVRSRT